MKKQKFYYKKSKGQNFLQNKSIIKKIIDSAKIDKNKTAVIEIGPGNGALSDFLIKECKTLIMIEIDPQLVEILEEKYKKEKHIKIICDDILSCNLKKLINDHLNNYLQNNIIIISNLPYYITSPILFKLFNLFDYIKGFILMMQKEVANRIVATTNEPSYNNLSIYSNFFTDVHKIIDVSKNNFFPKPKVDSTVLEFIFNKKYSLEDEAQFLNFIRKLFVHRRKTIANNLKNYVNDKEKAVKYLNTIKISTNKRPENLSLSDYHNL